MPSFLQAIEEGIDSFFQTPSDGQDASLLPSWLEPDEPQVLQPGLTSSVDDIVAAMGHWSDESDAGPATAPRARETPRGPEGVVYLGLNDNARESESRVLRGRRNATIVEAHGEDSEMQGKITSADGESVLDLSRDEDVVQYLRETGVGALRTDADGNPLETEEQAAARMAALQDFFLGAEGEDGTRSGGLPTDMRDEMAGFVRVLQQVEQGQTRMDRLVISGHSFGGSVFSDSSDNDMSFEQLGQLMQHFPEAQAGVEDLMLSACHTLEPEFGTDDGQQYKDIFPELRSVWGYNGFSPSFKQGSPRHIRDWERASRGNNPNAVRNAARGHGAARGKVFR